MGRMCGMFITTFTLPLSIIKVLSLDSISSSSSSSSSSSHHQVYLSTLMIHLLSPQHTPQHVYFRVIERIEQTKDTPIVLGLLTLFLKENLSAIIISSSSQLRNKNENDEDDENDGEEGRVSDEMRKRGKRTLRMLSNLEYQLGEVLSD